MRIAVADVLGWLAVGMTHKEILSDYRELTEDDIRACLAYAATGGLSRHLRATHWARNLRLVNNRPKIVCLLCYLTVS